MMTNAISQELTLLLNESQELILDGLGVQAIARLCDGLSMIRSKSLADEFRREVVPACRRHPLFELIQQDPYSRRAFEKPRGYAGDAVMLDYIYDGIAPPGTTQVGQVVFAGTTQTSNGLSVLDRRQRLANLVDEVARDLPGARIASLAAGHLREADLVKCLSENRLQQWLAIDQDAVSLQQIMQYGTPEIMTWQGSVANLIRGKMDIGTFDCFYSAGLFDYLNQRVAQKTLLTMFQHLNPGGVLLVCNFSAQSHGRSFMEAFMDWDLIYRDETELMRLLEAIPQYQVQSVQTYPDEHRNILYLQVVRTKD